MPLSDILNDKRILMLDELSGKKLALERLSQMIAESLAEVEFKHVFHHFVEREKLGSTALGHGVALPHIRLSELKQPIAAFMRINSPINFADSGQQPVDLIFALAVPDKDAQKDLDLFAMLSERFRNKDFRKALRQAENAQAVLKLFKENNDSSWHSDQH